MAGETYVKIATVDVGAGGSATIDITSIPATFTDLSVVLSVRCSSVQNATGLNMLINGNTSAVYSGTRLAGNGSITFADSQSATTIMAIGDVQGGNSTVSTFNNLSLYIPNYAGSTVKPILLENVMENNATLAYQWAVAGLFNSTSAITSLRFSWNNDNFVQYSSATLYGILKGSGGATVS